MTMQPFKIYLLLLRLRQVKIERICVWFIRVKSFLSICLVCISNRICLLSLVIVLRSYRQSDQLQQHRRLRLQLQLLHALLQVKTQMQLLILKMHWLMVYYIHSKTYLAFQIVMLMLRWQQIFKETYQKMILVI